MKIHRSTAMFGIAFVLVLVLDQVTKAAVRARLAYGHSWPEADTALGQFFSFTHVQNTGVAFGMFQSLGNVFLVTSILIAIGMLVYRRQISDDLPWAHFAIGMIVAGAIGNAIDRITIGHVTDFFDFKFWPVFNIADASVFLGVLLLMSQVWREERTRAQMTDSDSDSTSALDQAATQSTDASDDTTAETPA